jgi:hypothetical protein
MSEPKLHPLKETRMKDLVKVKQLEDVVVQMNAIFREMTTRLEKLEAAQAKPATKAAAKKDAN